MQSHTVDGVFLDVIGAKNWSAVTDFESWSTAERDAWTNGCIDLVRRLDEKRQQINPRFLIINNGPWERAGNDPTGIEGEQYVDGVPLEHPNWSTYHANYAGHSFAPRGHRRMLVVVSTQTDVDNWKTVAGATHIALQASYGQPGAPAVGFHQLFDRTQKFGRTTIATMPSSGLNADYKRASKFTMPKTGWLVDLEAYVDGLGGISGSQQVKLVVYRDNNGAPGAKVAESKFTVAGKWQQRRLEEFRSHRYASAHPGRLLAGNSHGRYRAGTARLRRRFRRELVWQRGYVRRWIIGSFWRGHNRDGHSVCVRALPGTVAAAKSAIRAALLAALMMRIVMMQAWITPPTSVNGHAASGRANA